MLITTMYFIVALFLLIIVHEYGHFLVARLCGVKVLRFSFGFGKVIAKYESKKGTEFAWSIFPIGGYVKMLDEEEGDVHPSEKHLAFNNKSVWARIAIVIAGPLFNFIFAFFAFWLMWMVGMFTFAPIIGQVESESLAYKAKLAKNQEIIKVGNTEVRSWRDFSYELMDYLGTDEKITIVTKTLDNNKLETHFLNLGNWQAGKNQDLLSSLGIKPFIPVIPLDIGDVQSNSPASIAGLQKGDKIKSIDGQPITNWSELIKYLQARPGKKVSLAILRGEKTATFEVTVGTQKANGKNVGFLGIMSIVPEWPQKWLRIERLGPIAAMNQAASQTVSLIGSTFTLIGRLFVGKLPLGTLSGPIGIAEAAGNSGKSGFAYYLSFLAMVSISLGVLNILPIPMLDGGHLLYYLIEVVIKKPVPDKIKSAGLYIGLLVLAALMIIAVNNDISRLSG